MIGEFDVLNDTVSLLALDACAQEADDGGSSYDEMAADDLHFAIQDDSRLETLDLFCPNAPVEVRVLTNTGMQIRRFDDHVAAATFAAQWDTNKNTKACYFTMNPYDASLIRGVGVDDRAVTRRRWLLIDVDPPRDHGNATDAEVQAARTVAAAIKSDLRSCGWSDPIEALSGNGLHLLYLIDLSNDPPAQALVSNILKVLAAKFDTSNAHVDQGVFNASRITKLYGSMCRKGPATVERPYRRSVITSVPSPLVCVSLDALQRVAGLTYAPTSKTPEPEPADQGFDRPARIARARTWLAGQPAGHTQGYRPDDEEQNGDSETYRLCCVVANDHDLSEDDAFAALGDWNARCSPQWPEKKLRHKIQHAIKYAKGSRGARVDNNPFEDMPPYGDPADTTSTRTRNVVVEDLDAFLQRMDRQPPLSWFVPGLIPDEGICLWHGQPRDFKSMCAQEMALALAAGRPAFSSARFTVSRAVKVAYFTEEDPERLFSARMHWLTARNPRPAPGFFFPFIRKSLSFDVEEDCDFIVRTIQETGVQVAVFDPVRSYTGLSDKGPSDLRPVALFLRRVQNETTAKTLVLVHHDTKPPAVSTEGSDRSRSQQASGGGIFSISDCPVSFAKTDWNRVAAFPEDYKLSGNPKPFEVTFETDQHDGDDGPKFGSWVRPIAETKDEHDIADAAAVKKIQIFLRSKMGQWFTAPEVNSGANLRKDTAGTVLHRLLEEGSVLHCTGDEAKALGRSPKAKLWSGIAAVDAESQPTRPDM